MNATLFVQAHKRLLQLLADPEFDVAPLTVTFDKDVGANYLASFYAQGEFAILLSLIIRMGVPHLPEYAEFGSLSDNVYECFGEYFTPKNKGDIDRTQANRSQLTFPNLLVVDRIPPDLVEGYADSHTRDDVHHRLKEVLAEDIERIFKELVQTLEGLGYA